MGTEACGDEFVNQHLSRKLPDETCNVVIEPLTPDSNRENGEHGNIISSQTPKETLFDSFAPGPDNFMLAPRYRKYRDESRINVVRRLNFSHESNGETISDEEDHLFQIIYASVLDAIASEQTSFRTDEVSGLDGSRTPKSPPHLTGIAETCPGAPVKSKSNYRNIDKEICKKLEF